MYKHYTGPISVTVEVHREFKVDELKIEILPQPGQVQKCAPKPSEMQTEVTPSLIYPSQSLNNKCLMISKYLKMSTKSTALEPKGIRSESNKVNEK